MGLDTTHDCWSGPYSQFMRWREWLAAQIGIPLNLMENYARWEYDESDLKKIPVGDPMYEPIRALVQMKGPIPWTILKDDPIVTLLNHSDCDGKIPWWECKAICLRLMEIYRQSDGSDIYGHGGMDIKRGCYDSMRMATLRFAAGCWRAWKVREDVGFY